MEFNTDNSGPFRAKIGETKSHMLTFSILSKSHMLPADETTTPDLKPVELMIRLSRLRYTGHVLRMDNTRLPKSLLNGEINIGKERLVAHSKTTGHALKKI